MLFVGCAAALRADSSVKTSVPAALRLRGGVSTETLTMVGAGLMGSSGLMAYISPKTTIAAYKVSAEFVDANALCGVRSLGAWQMALAALLLIPTVDVHSISHYLAAAAILISIPAQEVCDASQHITRVQKRSQCSHLTQGSACLSRIKHPRHGRTYSHRRGAH